MLILGTHLISRLPEKSCNIAWTFLYKHDEFNRFKSLENVFFFVHFQYRTVRTIQKIIRIATLEGSCSKEGNRTKMQ